MSINSELEELYRTYLDDLVAEGKKIISSESLEANHPANPLYLKVDEVKFSKSDLKIMVFGQETWRWGDGFERHSIKERMNRYEEFFLKKKYKKTSVFFKAFDFFEKNISNHYKDNEIVFLWNNISKIGRKTTKGVTSKIRNMERSYFPVIRKEIEILKPDIVIFLTGNRSHDIKFHFSDVSFKKVHYNSTLKSKNGKINFKPAYQLVSKYLPEKSVKLYHPSYFGGYNNTKDDAIKFLLE